MQFLPRPTPSHAPSNLPPSYAQGEAILVSKTSPRARWLPSLKTSVASFGGAGFTRRRSVARSFSSGCSQPNAKSSHGCIVPGWPTRVGLFRPAAGGRPTPSRVGSRLVAGGRPLARSAWSVRVHSAIHRCPRPKAGFTRRRFVARSFRSGRKGESESFCNAVLLT